jgi:DNA-binding Lrp family transcriptional regulator
MKKQLRDILDWLEKLGASSSNDIQTALKMSQSSVSRSLIELEDEIFSIGTGKNVRYAVGKPIGSLPAQQPIYIVRENGQIEQLGTLSFLAKSQIYLESNTVCALFESTLENPLPWILSGLKTQGFLGRLVAQQMSLYGYGSNPDLWGAEEILFAATKIQDSPGALLIGHIDSIKSNLAIRISSDNPGPTLDFLSEDIAKTLPSGSSAGGEQPKFLAFDDKEDAFVVKFSAPLGTPFGDRWSDLLIAESLCSEALTAFGFDCAESKIVKTKSRTYLLSKRFDRLGEFGRKHVVSIGSVHAAFIKGSYINWAATCFDLEQKKRLPKGHADNARDILHFGHLVGNTDMHSGNAGFFVEGDHLKELLLGQFKLAPVYDMLPMRWKPNPMLGIYDYEPFEVNYSATGLKIRQAAQCFWFKLSQHEQVSQSLRAVSVMMASRMGIACP